MAKSTPWPEYDATTRGQFQASDPERSAWVAANAGSGKTKVLIDRVARLLLEGVAPDAILCVTYTKAAASEMQARLFRRLGGWCVAADKELRADLGDLQGRDTEAYQPEDLGKARELFARALETPGGLRIETLHAFCGRLLRRFPLEAGAPPGFRELDDADAARLWERSLAKLGALAGGDDNIGHAIRDVALFAGARGVSEPLRALGGKRAEFQTFIQKAGGLDGAIGTLRDDLNAPLDDEAELLERGMGSDLPVADLKPLIPILAAGAKTDQASARALETAISDAPADLRFHAYAGLVFTQKGELRAKNPFTKAMGEVAPALIDLFNLVDMPQGREALRLDALNSAIKARRLYERSSALLRVADAAFSDFAMRKRARAALDFDDLVETASDLLTRASSADWVLWKLDGGLSHVLLDEAQDTSPGQWRLLNALTQDFFAGLSVERETPRTLFVVGDEKQSIYSFQGADPERFLTERRAFAGRAQASEAAYALPDMTMSFRSAPEILSFVDSVFGSDAFDGEAPFSIEAPPEADLVRHSAYRRTAKGSVELWPLTPPDAPPEAEAWDAPRGQERETSPKAELARRIADWVRGVIDRGELVGEGEKRRPARPGDVMILVRGRKGGLFDAILRALKRAGLPVAGADRIDLLDSAPVQDVLNLVRFVLRPEDDLALAEILTGPFGGLTEDADLFPLAYGRRATSLWSRLSVSADPRHEKIAASLRSLQARADAPPFEFLSFALHASDVAGRSGFEQLLARFGSPAREPLAALMDRAEAFDASPPSALQTFLAQIEREGGEVKRELSGPQDEVRVMTAHGAKGLEAPIVILPDTCAAPQSSVDAGVMLTAGGAPVWSAGAKEDTSVAARLRAGAEARAIREHRRLLYVALTRAEDRLLICGAWSGGLKSKTGRAEKSWHAVCSAAMERLAASGLADSVVDKEGREILRLGQIAETDQSDVGGSTPPLTPDWLKRAALEETSARRVAAPSSLGPEEPAVLAPFGPDRTRRLRRGRLIHTLLQTLPDLPFDARTDAAHAFLQRETDLSEDEQAEMAKAAFGVLNDPAFDPIFAPGGRAEAPIVGENAEKLGPGVLINGRVDRLVVTPKDVLVVDFKTDRPAPARVEDVGPAYLAQMAAYRAVLQTAYPDRVIRCALVWTDGPQMMELAAEHMDQALKTA